MTTEIPLKQWIAEEAEAQRKAIPTIERRLQRGKYPWLKLRRVNQRVIYVKAP